ncbi:MAG: hypothetical protein M3Y18_09935, partial [Candidatus Eremiobacteraeota bacterium]|nr:hypothetical protein [Candidatus Eremiobacteraeota bacterium]
MIASLLLSSIFGVPCWDMLDDAIRRRASAVHPAYVSYDERIFVQENRVPLMRSTTHVDYRDDGLARVADERFSNVPYITTREEPGPPELGPYGNGRESWLSANGPGLKLIGDVRS